MKKQIIFVSLVIMSVLLSMCGQPDQEKLNSMLAKAVIEKDSKKCKELIQKGADVNQFVDKDVSLLHQSIYSKSIEIVKALVEGGADVNLPDESQKAPLSIAASFDNPEIVDILIKHGADVNHVNNNRLRTTAVMEAAGENSVKVLKILIKHNADLDIPDANGDPAIDFACFVGAYEAALFLIDAGANLEKANPLFFAMQSGNEKLIDYLRSHGFKNKNE